MKRNVVLVFCSFFVWTSLLGNAQEQEGFVKSLLSHYASKFSNQPTSRQESDEISKTKSRYRRWIKQAENIFLVLLLDVIIIRVWREKELTKNNKELQDFNQEKEKIREEINKMRDKMVEEVQHITEEKMRGDTCIETSYKQSLESISTQIDILNQKQKQIDTAYEETVLMVNEQISAVQKLEQQIQEIKKEIQEAKEFDAEEVTSNTLDKETRLKGIEGRLDAIEKRNKQLTEEFKKRQFDKNKQFETDIEDLKKQISSENLKNSGANTL